MDCTAQFLEYHKTGAFSPIVLDYIRASETLRPFFTHPVSLEGIGSAIKARQAFPTDRKSLVKALEEQYKTLPGVEAVQKNLGLLSRETTFAVTTAHQPNIFTGHLYFVYKILHVIRICAEAKEAFPKYDFVPVYFMGSEDADLDELGHIYAGGETLTWDTKQTGAVGRMSPKGLEKIIDVLQGEFGGLPFGRDMISLCHKAYTEHSTIQDATRYLVHMLFAEFGLIVLVPDDPSLKGLFQDWLKKELFEGFSHKAVNQTIENLSRHYKVQAAGREINLFYLKDNLRNRLVQEGDNFRVLDTDLVFTREAMEAEVQDHPERFSPNVILRGVFQEVILPGIAFVGGGGELAYWLELKDVFNAAKVPYPMLVLRNSFQLVRKAWANKAEKLGIPLENWFASEQELFSSLVLRESRHQLSLRKEMDEIKAVYKRLSELAGPVDITLQPHVAALQTRTMDALKALEKKLLKAEKRRFEAQQRQINSLLSAMFPNGSLQERVENLMPYFAEFGPEFIRALYQHSLTLEPRFCILTIS